MVSRVVRFQTDERVVPNGAPKAGVSRDTPVLLSSLLGDLGRAFAPHCHFGDSGQVSGRAWAGTGPAPVKTGPGGCPAVGDIA